MPNTKNTTFDYLYAVYNTLRKIKGEEFRPENFKFRLGNEVVKELFDATRCYICLNEPITLFGIEVEHDFYSPKNVQIFEDITNKISIPFEEYELREGANKCQSQ